MTIQSPVDETKTISFADIVHTGPGTIAGRYMRNFWQPICLSESIEPGRARREMIMSQYVTVYRGQGGQIHAVADRCPHRGTQLSVGWVEKDSIRCFYHGWLFNGHGQCMEQPAERESQASKIKIAGYPVREYLGFVFIYLGEGEAPEFPVYPEIEDEKDGQLIIQTTAPIPCNFFQRVENAVDQVHVAFAHRDVYGQEGMGSLPEYRVEETDYGICAHGERDDAGDRVTHFHMPNINVLMVPPGRGEAAWAPFVTWRVPVDDESYRNFAVRRIRMKPGMKPSYPDRSQEQVDVARAIVEGRMRLDDIDPTDRGLLIPVQDNIAQMAQGTIADRSQDHLARSDIGVAMLRRIWRRELERLAAGEPVKHWQRPEGGLTLQSGAPQGAAA